MLSKYIRGKVYIFIDAENLFYSQQSLGWQVSYEKLMSYFKNECGKEIKCFVYSGIDESNEGQKKFIDMLDINGFIVRTKNIKKIRTGLDRYKWKSNLDIELAFEMVDLAESYDTAVLVSGDSDFALPLDRIKKKGKNVIVMSTKGRISKELLERAKYIDLKKIVGNISQ